MPVISLLACLISYICFKPDMSVPHAVKLDESGKIYFGSKADLAGGKKSSSFINYTAVAKCHDEFSNTTTKIKAYSQGDRSFYIEADTSHCGAYTYTLKYIKIYDLLGLFCIPKRCKSSHVMMVRPLPQKPEIMPDIEGSTTKSLHKSKSQYSEIYDLRDYAAGDSVKNIHWKMSAKKDSILVKEPLEEELENAKIFFELSSSREEMDKRLGEIIFVSNFYLRKDIHHLVSVMSEGREIVFEIFSFDDIENMIDKLLMMELPKNSDTTQAEGGNL